MVPVTGLEPVRYRYRGILSPLCLPIPPHRRISAEIIIPHFPTVVNDFFLLEFRENSPQTNKGKKRRKQKNLRKKGEEIRSKLWYN